MARLLVTLAWAEAIRRLVPPLGIAVGAVGFPDDLALRGLPSRLAGGSFGENY